MTDAICPSFSYSSGIVLLYRLVRVIWTIKKENNMDANKVDPIPAHFNSPEEAGEFWDTHSAADYWMKWKKVRWNLTFRNGFFGQ